MLKNTNMITIIREVFPDVSTLTVFCIDWDRGLAAQT